MDESAPVFHDRHDVARMLAVGPDTITGMVDAGELTAIVLRRGKKRYLRFDPTDLREQLERMKSARPTRYTLTPRPDHTPHIEADPWQSTSAPQRKAQPAGR